MAGQFAKLFWGLLLVILDISINGFDLLIDGLGYLIVASACGGLVSLSPQFGKARVLSFLLAGLWALGFLVKGDGEVIYGLMVTVVNCVMIWQLLGGVGTFANSRGREDLARKASNRRLAYVAIMSISSLLGLIAGGSRDLAPLIIVLVVSTLVLVFLILQLIHRVKVELAE